MDKSEEIKARAARYNRTEIVTDSLGRTIKVKLLKPSQRIMVEEMFPGLTGTVSEDVTDPNTGLTETIQVQRIARVMFAAAVVGVDDAVLAFPRNREDLNFRLDLLDSEGLEAASYGVVKLYGEGLPADGADPKDLAKNSAPTPDFDRPAG